MARRCAACACLLPRYHAVVAAVTFLVLMIGSGVRTAPGLLTVQLEAATGWDRGVIGGAVALNTLLYGVLGPFVVAAIGALGVPRVVVASLLSLALGVGVSSEMAGATPALLYVMWGVLVGVGSAGVATVLGAVVADRWFVRRRSTVVGIFAAANAAGSLVFATPIAQVAVSFGWRAGVWLVGAVALALVPLVLALLVDRPEEVGLRRLGEAEEEAAAPQRVAAADDAEDAAAEPPQQDGAAAGASASPPACLVDASGGVAGGAAAPRLAAAARDAAPRPVAAGATPSAGPPPPAAPLPAAAPPSPSASAVRAAFAALAEGVRSRDFVLLALSFAVCGASSNGLILPHFVPAAVDAGLSEVRAAGMLTAMGVLDIFGTLGSGLLTERVDARVLLAGYYALRGTAREARARTNAANTSGAPLTAAPTVRPSPQRRAVAFLPTALRLQSQDAGLWPYAIIYGLDWIATVPPTKRLCDVLFPGRGERGAAQRLRNASRCATCPRPRLTARVPPRYTATYMRHAGSLFFGWCLAFHQIGAAVVAAAGGVARTRTGTYDVTFWSASAVCLATAAGMSLICANSLAAPTLEPASTDVPSAAADEATETAPPTPKGGAAAKA